MYLEEVVRNFCVLEARAFAPKALKRKKRLNREENVTEKHLKEEENRKKSCEYIILFFLIEPTNRNEPTSKNDYVTYLEIAGSNIHV